MTYSTWTIGPIEVTRLADPADELTIARDEAGTAVLEAEAGWLRPHFTTDDHQLRVGTSAMLVRSGDTRVVIDPWATFDNPDRTEARVAELTEVGFAPNDVDVVINTHLDGIGLNVRTDAEGAPRPTFANACYLLADSERVAAAAGERNAEGIEAVVEAGLSEPAGPGDEIAAGVTLRAAGGHTPDHMVVEVGDRELALTGHTLLHPAQAFAPGPDADLDSDPERAAATRRTLLADWAAAGTLVVGPLFTGPGAGRLEPAGDQWRLIADETNLDR